MSQSRRQFIRGTVTSLAVAGCDAEAPPKTSPLQNPTASTPMPNITATGAQLDHPLLLKLHEVDQHIRKNFKLPRWADAGVGSVGLILNQTLENGGYWCSPSNALTFATTGGDGDHYSLLVKGGVISETSPVVLTWPSEGAQTIVGATLYDFLCFGIHGGYFQVLSGHTDEPTVESNGLLFHPHVEDYQQNVLAYLAAELDLTPWPHSERSNRFNALQSEILPLVEASDDP